MRRFFGACMAGALTGAGIVSMAGDIPSIPLLLAGVLALGYVLSEKPRDP